MPASVASCFLDFRYCHRRHSLCLYEYSYTAFLGFVKRKGIGYFTDAPHAFDSEMQAV
jgi:hypothetical protein